MGRRARRGRGRGVPRGGGSRGAGRLSTALASRVGAALGEVGARERTALERIERDGASYADVAAELALKREQVADLLVAARLRVSEAVDGEPVPERLTPQCGPARRVITARLDGEAVSSRDLDRAGAHVEACEPCQAARMALQEARLACRVWSAAPPAPVSASSGARRGRLAAVLAGAALLLVLLVLALGGGSSDTGPAAPAAPPVGQGSAEAEGAQDVVPPPGDAFCLPDAPDCP